MEPSSSFHIYHHASGHGAHADLVPDLLATNCTVIKFFLYLMVITHESMWMSPHIVIAIASPSAFAYYVRNSKGGCFPRIGPCKFPVRELKLL
jgi:hypothetical protein